MAGKRKDSKGRLLRTGESVRSDGRYCYQYTAYGKRKSIYDTDLQKLRVKEKKIKMDLEDGLDVEKGSMPLNSLFDSYMSTKTRLKASTRQNYIKLWDNTVKESSLGKLKISQIKQVHIKKFYADLQKNGLSQGTIKNVHNLLSASFKMAVSSDYVRKNPCDGCLKDISGNKTEKKALTREEQKALISFLENSFYNKYLPMITVFLNTGLRESELAGLRRADCDFKENLIHVRRQVVYKDFDGNGFTFHVQSLKTQSSERIIPMNAACRKALQQQKKQDLMLGIERKEVCGYSDYVFVTRNGTPYESAGFNNKIYGMVKKYNSQETEKARKEGRKPFLLPHISCHTLRHTFCSRAAESGIEPKVLQSIMGHSSIQTTLDIYTHLDVSEIKRQFSEAEIKMNVG